VLLCNAFDEFEDRIPGPSEAALRRRIFPPNFQLGLLRVEERPLSVAFPEIREDDHTCDRRIRAPQ